MPYLNALGQVAHGKGGAGAYYNNALFDTGGLACWVDKNIVYQHGGEDGEYVAFYDIAYNTKIRAVTSPNHPFYNWGVNALYAGGGVWAGFAAAPGRGLFTSTGVHLPNAGLAGVGPDGAIAYVLDYQAGAPVRVRERDGADWVLSHSPIGTASAPRTTACDLAGGTGRWRAWITIAEGRRAGLDATGGTDPGRMVAPLCHSE